MTKQKINQTTESEMNEMKMADTVKNNNTGPGIERKKRERRNDFPPEAKDQSKLAELISL